MLGHAVIVHDSKIDQVANGLDDIQGAVCGSEAVVFFQGLEPIDVINVGIQFVRTIERPDVFAAGHGVRAQKHVAAVPDDEGNRDGEPDERQVRRSMRPC